MGEYKECEEGYEECEEGYEECDKSSYSSYTSLHFSSPWNFTNFHIFWIFFSLENIIIFLLILSKLRNDENYPKKI